MTFRQLTLLGALCLAAACNKDECTDATCDTDPVPDTDTETTPTGPTGVEIAYWEPRSMLITGEFGYDGVNAVSGTDPDDATVRYGMFVNVYVYTDQWTGSFDETAEYCVVQLQLTEGAVRDVTADPGLVFAWDPGRVATSCDSDGVHELDPALWPAAFVGGATSLAEALITNADGAPADLFVGLGPVSPNLNPDVVEDTEIGCAVGIPEGVYSIQGTLYPPPMDLCVAQAYQVQGTDIVLGDDGLAVPLTREQTLSGDQLATAYYILSTFPVQFGPFADAG